MKRMLGFLRKSCLFLLLVMMFFGSSSIKAAMLHGPQNPLFILCFNEDQINQHIKNLVTRWWKNEGLASALGLLSDQDMAALPADAPFKLLKEENFKIRKPTWHWIKVLGVPTSWDLDAGVLKNLEDIIKGARQPVVIIAGYTQASSYLVQEVTKKLPNDSIHSIILLDPSVYRDWNFNAISNRMYNFYTKTSTANVRKIGPTFGKDGFVKIGNILRSKVVNILCEEPFEKVINFFEKNSVSQWLLDTPIAGLIRKINEVYHLNADLKAVVYYDKSNNIVAQLMINRPWELVLPDFSKRNLSDYINYYGSMQNIQENWVLTATRLTQLGIKVHMLQGQVQQEQFAKIQPIVRQLLKVKAIEEWGDLFEEEVVGVSTISLASSTTGTASTPTVVSPVTQPIITTPSAPVSSTTTTSTVIAPVIQPVQVEPSSEKEFLPTLTAFANLIPHDLQELGESFTRFIPFDVFVKLIRTYSQFYKSKVGSLQENEFFVQKLLLDKNKKNEICFIGDIHGSVLSLIAIFKELKKNNFLNDDFSINTESHPNFRMVFTGDYVDRGHYGVEVLYLLLRLKLAGNNWDRVFLLRGNHENLEINKDYGFIKEIETKYPESVFIQQLQGNKSCSDIIKFFLGTLYNFLPQALCIGYDNDWVLACHGCLDEDVSDQIKTFLTSSSIIGKLTAHTNTDLTSLLWCDILYRYTTFVFSMARAQLGERDVLNPKQWLASVGLKAIFRGHQHYFDGLKMISNNKYEIRKHFEGYPVSWKEFVTNPTDPIFIDKVECPIFTFTTAKLKRDGNLPMATDVFYGIVTTNEDFAKWTLTPHLLNGQSTEF